ncbi:MAG: nucleotidyl transferase AbiEii/AbiGii toxin family protein [Treponema sp.]|uniref:nucleotidyl transferase AbiEii/AbiGii toxin family protein n=1 Tax=Treponema sp. TaxID=166 RepID=UPI0025F2169A|nr:nucleotidyl transferase AbiEii/AbiGii toxin family protein [Treponema sp.]MBQ9623805.1 nucleotidyl transferase AbiEii/AbiGii toxin family protein [Treponema sp.]MBR0495489.1 nucleotidyl transferase AbiEii/AbiGii toxin family protein [Treponema sp.]
MTTPVQQMIEKYGCKNTAEYKNALKEVIQEVALCGLSRGGFFNKAAFYGGTALRIFYGLDRFSEDMDFSLLSKDETFEIDSYFSYLREELLANGFELSVERKEKSSESDVQSAFIKGGTLTHLLKIMPANEKVLGVTDTELIKIKFEIDTNPPEGAKFETKYALLPIPYLVQMYDEGSLFAGKIHAVLCRAWKNRVKGRDFYDYLWYLARGTQPNLFHLQKRLEQSGKWNVDEKLTSQKLKELLCERFALVDFEIAKQDVLPFIGDSTKLALWGKDFFCSVTNSSLK